jgi:hypothetical protein
VVLLAVKAAPSVAIFDDVKPLVTGMVSAPAATSLAANVLAVVFANVKATETVLLAVCVAPLVSANVIAAGSAAFAMIV